MMHHYFVTFTEILRGNCLINLIGSLGVETILFKVLRLSFKVNNESLVNSSDKDKN